ncbi:hypothetical protein JMJ55_15285 [Belnapia sp. T6]|uniref:Uncharacterized protein n=1 Tax=Belnapia mucosa TaxID=2804532 RepID=A0ABS1V8M5_9PROT|nr:hypothetical protein [Belnapia mucosa]MBL6456698.1 hypothetical protein [Belnapia mucosa]
MDQLNQRAFGPGTSVLGGAAAGLTYDGALRDAYAREEVARRREAGRSRRVPAPQTQRQERAVPEPLAVPVP